MKEKLLLVMPMTLGVLLLTVICMTGDILVNNTPSVESPQLVSYNSQPIEKCVDAHVIDSKAANLSYGVTSGVSTVMCTTMPVVTKNDVVVTRSSFVEEPQLITVNSISMRNADGVWEDTSELLIDIDALVETYNTEYEIPEWDDKNKINMIATVWEFLVNQQGMNPNNAAALLGNIMAEGSFSIEQGTYNLMNNIESLRAVLGQGNRGYGMVQWTYGTRQKALLEYYEVAYDMYPDDWDKVKIIAECSMLLEEVKAYRVFDDIYTSISLEDSTGRVCRNYETYDGCYSGWSYYDGTYHLNATSGSSYHRYAYAKAIYDYFTE